MDRDMELLPMYFQIKKLMFLSVEELAAALRLRLRSVGLNYVPEHQAIQMKL